MKHIVSYLCLALALAGFLLVTSSLQASAIAHTQDHPASSFTTGSLMSNPLLAAPRWWDDTMQWIRNLGWDRGRLVQLWLFFMLIGLYVILRIKPRA